MYNTKANLSLSQQQQNYLQLCTTDLETTVRLSDHNLYVESRKTFGESELKSLASDDFNQHDFITI